MKILIALFILFSFSFSFDNIHSTLKECSQVEDDTQRLNCYDSLALSKKPKTALEIQGEKLIAKCIICHGNNWEYSTNGERLVKDMSEKEIYDSLLSYKRREIKSPVMNFQMGKFNKKEIETMTKYISHQIRNLD